MKRLDQIEVKAREQNVMEKEKMLIMFSFSRNVFLRRQKVSKASNGFNHQDSWS